MLGVHGRLIHPPFGKTFSLEEEIVDGAARSPGALLVGGISHQELAHQSQGPFGIIKCHCVAALYMPSDFPSVGLTKKNEMLQLER